MSRNNALARSTICRDLRVMVLAPVFWDVALELLFIGDCLGVTFANWSPVPL
jgi:hypothetical protein